MWVPHGHMHWGSNREEEDDQEDGVFFLHLGCSSYVGQLCPKDPALSEIHMLTKNGEEH